MLHTEALIERKSESSYKNWYIRRYEIQIQLQSIAFIGSLLRNDEYLTTFKENNFWLSAVWYL